MRRRGGVGAHRFIDHGMELDAGVGAANMRRQRQRERDEMVTGYEYGPALTVSDKNFDLASTVFECVTLYHCARTTVSSSASCCVAVSMLDKDKNGRLESTDFVLAGSGDREAFHQACRPVPAAGIDFHEFLRRCARFCCKLHGCSINRHPTLRSTEHSAFGRRRDAPQRSCSPTSVTWSTSP